MREQRECIKRGASRGICTINSARQDWIVCPYRALDPQLLQNAVRRLFAIDDARSLMVVPAPTLEKETVRSEVGRTLAAGGAVVAYLQDKLGGEVSVARTERSPELSFDVTLVEILEEVPGTCAIGRYGILEVQTMDFHGSYRAVVKNLADALRLHGDRFAESLQDNQGWLSQEIEGPNIANVFKRTFYQMILKFRIGAHPPCVGCIMAIQTSVWGSWQRHLGKPDLVPRKDGTFALREGDVGDEQPPAWIYVFDTDGSGGATPAPIAVQKVIATDAESIAHYALKVVPDAVIAAGGAVDAVLAGIRQRMVRWWPQIDISRFDAGSLSGASLGAALAADRKLPGPVS